MWPPLLGRLRRPMTNKVWRRGRRWRVTNWLSMVMIAFAAREEGGREEAKFEKTRSTFRYTSSVNSYGELFCGECTYTSRRLICSRKKRRPACFRPWHLWAIKVSLILFCFPCRRMLPGWRMPVWCWCRWGRRGRNLRGAVSYETREKHVVTLTIRCPG